LQDLKIIPRDGGEFDIYSFQETGDHGGLECEPSSERSMPNQTEPKTPQQWIRYIVVAGIALWLVYWMLRSFVL
jgi:hypothetical protein